MSNFLEKHQLKCTSPEVQNEFLSIMSAQILRNIAANIQRAVSYTVMVVETTNKSNRSKSSSYFAGLMRHSRCTNSSLVCSSTTAEALVSIIKDTFLRIIFKFDHCRGQCYDGGSAMSESKRGVAKIISDAEPRAVYTHCYGHALNPSMCDCIKQSKVMKSALDVVAEISKLIKKSPKRDSFFERLKKHLVFMSCVLPAGQYVPHHLSSS